MLLEGKAACRRAYSKVMGGPINTIPCASHNAGSWMGIALVLVTSRKKASICPAGVNTISILPVVSPLYAYTCGTLRGANTESPALSNPLSLPISMINSPSKAKNHSS